MKFNTWDEVVTYVFWTKRQLPPTDATAYAEAKEKIMAFHLAQGYAIPAHEIDKEDYAAEMAAEVM